ncbi:hypothetical protein LguiB_019502 [Lonicera macranthoides]
MVIPMIDHGFTKESQTSQISILANHPANCTPYSTCSSINTAIASHLTPKNLHPNGASIPKNVK